MNYRFVHKSCFFNVKIFAKFPNTGKGRRGGRGAGPGHAERWSECFYFLFINSEVDFLIFPFHKCIPVLRWQLRRSSGRTELQNGERGRGDCTIVHGGGDLDHPYK